MAIERTFSIVKPDAVSKNLIGEIYHRMESAGLTIVAAKMLRLTSEQAAGFYAEHQGRPFYDALVTRFDIEEAWAERQLKKVTR